MFNVLTVMWSQLPLANLGWTCCSNPGSAFSFLSARSPVCAKISCLLLTSP